MSLDPYTEEIRKLKLKLRAGDGTVDLGRLMDRYPDAVVPIMVAYEAGYEDGESLAYADFHEDNPHAIKLAYELIGKALNATT